MAVYGPGRAVRFADHSDGMQLLLSFNPTERIWRPKKYKPITEPQVLNLFAIMVAGTEDLLPELQQSIGDNQHLYPDKNNLAAAMGHRLRLLVGRTEVMASVGVAVAAGLENAERLLLLANKNGRSEVNLVEQDERGIRVARVYSVTRKPEP